MISRLLSLVLLILVNSGQAAQAGFESGPEQNLLIELYTSEGCSSCPPAESYLNNLLDHPQLWREYIPLAFHVDYWNHLGWRDRFSSASYSARQRAYARYWRSRTVYTPEFFVNGREWRRWFRSAPPDSKFKRIGNLKAQLKGEQLLASFEPLVRLPDKLVLHVAVLGMHRRTEIQAGENAGRLSSHQFVVLGHKAVSSEQRQWQTRLPQRIIDEPGREAIAIWVTQADSPVTLQAAGSMLSSATDN